MTHTMTLSLSYIKRCDHFRILKSNRFRRDQDPLKIAGSSFDDQSSEGMSMVVSLNRTITHCPNHWLDLFGHRAHCWLTKYCFIKKTAVIQSMPPTRISPDDSAYRPVQLSWCSKSHTSNANLRREPDELRDLDGSSDSTRTSNSTEISRSSSVFLVHLYLENRYKCPSKTASPDWAPRKRWILPPTASPLEKYHPSPRTALPCRRSRTGSLGLYIPRIFLGIT